MIHDVDATLRALIERDVMNGAGVELSFDAPTKEWAAKLSLPTINVFLYDIREDTTRRDIFFEEVRDDNGRVIERRQPPRRMRLAYLLSAWTKRAEDEHRLLSALLGCFLAADVLPPDLLVGSLAAADRPVITQTALSIDGTDQFSEVWGALGGELRPSIHLAVIAPFDVSRSVTVGPPVTETPRITVVRPDDVTEAPRPAKGGGRGRRAQPAAEAAPVPALPDEVVRAGAEDDPGRVFRVRAMPERR
ncbi:MAG TPA: DUF4255 domain-containing protein [Ilumatobacteraceae bacterium]|nr:DUF4255 domain-containing protein [Ilumatobacteraceae bacterium]